MRPKRHLVQLTFYETYYFANAIKKILENQLNYLRSLNDFCGDDQYLAYISPFWRFSALHIFILFVLNDILNEEAMDVGLDLRQDELDSFQGIPSALDPHPSKFPVNLALDAFGIKHEGFETWLQARGRNFMDARDDDVSEYHQDLRYKGQFEELLDRATAEVFFVLFQNRRVLLLFNEMMASEVRESGFIDPEHANFFAQPGALRRVPVPAWVQRAVFFRDRGMCVFCHKDLSGILAIGTEENYDHIVPLGRGGLNDVTNIQLLCRECNSKKRAGSPMTSDYYEAWYSKSN